MKRADGIARRIYAANLSPTNTRTSSSAELNRARALPASPALPPCPRCGDGVRGGRAANRPPGVWPCRTLQLPCPGAATARRLRSLQVESGPWRHCTALTFENFHAEPSHLPPDKQTNLRRACETCSNFAAQPEGWLLLSGSYGCGKTHLAAAIANRRVALGAPALFMIVPESARPPALYIWTTKRTALR
jgi:ribosomal protein S27AE